jgi:iron complex transport system substrate-binding protein
MTPPRIVSLLPSATEILCAAGGEQLLVGRSHECDWPPSVAQLPALTGQRVTATTSAEIDRQVRETLEDGTGGRSLYTVDGALLEALKPDVVLTQDLCEVCSIDLHAVRAITESMAARPIILSLNPASINDVFDDVLRVGDAANIAASAQPAMIALRERHWAARECVNAYTPRINTAFVEWVDPLFIGGHWTPELIEYAGGAHRLNPPGAKSRQINPEELLESMPERLIICPCGFDLAQIRRELHLLTSQRWWTLLPAVQKGQVALVDGNQMFNRPGPRLIDALEWLVSWLCGRPELAPPGFPVERAAW